MKILNLLLALMIVCGVSSADVVRNVESLKNSSEANEIPVASTGTVYTKAFSLRNNPLGPVGVMFKATSSGVVNLQLQAQQSYGLPATEGAFDSAYQNWKTVETVTDQNWHVATLDTVVMPYGRYRIVGTGSNDASTTIKIKIGKN